MSAYSAAVLATANLTAYWRLGDSSGAAVDQMAVQNGTYGAGCTLSQTGALTASGDTDTAVLFSGTATGVVTLASNATLDTTGDITAEAWMKLGASPGTDRLIFGFYNAGATAGWGFGWNESASNGSIDYISGASGGVWKHSTTLITDQAWHQVAVTVANTAISFYVDGQPAGTAVGVRPNTYTGTRSLGARFDGADPWVGSLDEMSFYKRALSSQEILDHYNAGITPPVPANRMRRWQY